MILRNEELMYRKLITIALLVILTGCTAFNSDTAPEVLGSGEVCDIE